MISILIIDDTSEKVNNFKLVLDKFCLSDMNYSIVNDIKNAINELNKHYYDLVVLDMFIPFEWGGEPDPQNAIDFISQINQDEDLHQPLSILAITKINELGQEIKEKLNQTTISLLQYKENSDVWKLQFENRIKALIGIKKNLFTRQCFDYDIAVINALQIPEHEMLKKVFGCKWSTIKVESDAFNNYYEGLLEDKNGKTIRCVATYANQMAGTASASLTTKVIYNFRPKYLFMTGIAAGVENKVINYGDILVASEVWDGASGKIKTDQQSGKTIFEPDYRQKSLDSEFTNIISRLKANTDLLSSIENNYQTRNGKPQTHLAIHSGPMASVPAVLSCKNEIDKIQQHARKLQGIEMESYGMFYAAANAIKPLPKIVASLKSVSDFADVKKNDNYQEYASYTSAALLKHIITNELDF